MKKRDCDCAFDTYYDERLKETRKIVKQKPVLICYQYAGKKYFKAPDEKDFSVLQKIDTMNIPYWYPTERMCEGKESRQNWFNACASLLLQANASDIVENV